MQPFLSPRLILFLVVCIAAKREKSVFSLSIGRPRAGTAQHTVAEGFQSFIKDRFKASYIWKYSSEKMTASRGTEKRPDKLRQALNSVQLKREVLRMTIAVMYDELDEHRLVWPQFSRCTYSR